MRERELRKDVGGVVRRKNESNRLRYTSHLHLLSDCEYRYSYLVCVLDEGDDDDDSLCSAAPCVGAEFLNCNILCV